METRNVDAADSETFLPLVGGVLTLFATGLPWFGLELAPAGGVAAGYGTAIGLLAGIIALVVLVTTVFEVTEIPAEIALVGGLLVAVLAGVRALTLGDALAVGTGVYVAIVGGVIMAVGGIAGR